MMQKDLFQLLKKDHQEIKTILKQMTKRGESINHMDLQEKLRHELIPHMEGEEKSLYPALKENKKSSMAAFKAIEEHRVAKAELEEVKRLHPGSEEWDAKVSVLRQLIESHIEEEESELFKISKQVLSSEQLESVQKRFMEVKEQAMAMA